MLKWQQCLLRCGTLVAERLAALEHLPQDSPWRQSVVRYDPRLWPHLPEEAAVWIQVSEERCGTDADADTPEGVASQCCPELQALSTSAAAQVASYVRVASATRDAPTHDVVAAQDAYAAGSELVEAVQRLCAVAIQHRDDAEARLALARRQQDAIQALDRVTRRAKADVTVAVAKVQAAVAGTKRSDVDAAARGRQAVMVASAQAVHEALDECFRTGMTESDVASSAPGAAAQTLLAQLRGDAEASELVQENVLVRASIRAVCNWKGVLTAGTWSWR